MKLQIVKKVIFFIIFNSMNLLLNAEENQPPPYLQYVNEIVRPYAQQMAKEFNLFYNGGGGSMPHDVEIIEVCFSARRRASVEEARALIVKMAEKLALLVNDHEKIRPYLREYPFKPGRAMVTLSFGSDEKLSNCDGTVAFTFVSIHNTITFCRKEPITNQLIDICEEPYAEAFKIVQETIPPQRDLSVHQPLPYETHIDTLLSKFTKEAEKKWGLILLLDGGKLADGIEEISIRFGNSTRAPLERARELEVLATERLLELVNSAPEVRPYLKEYPFPANRARIAIMFKKDKRALRMHNNDYYTDGSVAFVRQENNRIFYLTRKPDDPPFYPIGLEPITDEPYEEAKKQMLEKNVISKKLF